VSRSQDGPVVASAGAAGFGILSSASPPLVHRCSIGQGFLLLAWYYCTTPVKTSTLEKQVQKNKKS